MSSSTPRAAALLDSRGCLTDAGLRILEAAPPGAAPAELASHLVSCVRCQGRVLAGLGGAAPPRRQGKPAFWRVLLLAVVALLLAVGALLAVTMLARR